MSEAIAIDAGLFTCTLCGTRFDPRGTSVCGSCPLASGCSLACCPACGFGVPDPSRSAVGRLAGRARAWRRRAADSTDCDTLARVPRGAHAVIGTLDDVPTRQREQLLAYGIAPGRLVKVLQVSPVTILRVEHAEFAFEKSLSRAIGVTPVAETGGL